MKGKLQLKDITILAVDTSGATLAIAIMKNDVPVAVCDKNTGLTHSESLLPEIIELFSKTNIKPADIDYFVCSNGPGSFTGLRIGISTMKGLAHAFNKPMIEAGTLDALKINLNSCNDMIICPMIDARREEVYTAVYKNDEKILRDTPISITELCEFLLKENSDVIFNGDGAVAYREKICMLMGEKAHFPEESLMLPKGVSVGLCGLSKIEKGMIKSHRDFSVNYIKPSQPEMQRNRQ